MAFPIVLLLYYSSITLVLVLSSVCYCLLVGDRPAPPLSPSQAPTWELQSRPWEIGLRLLQPDQTVRLCYVKWFDSSYDNHILRVSYPATCSTFKPSQALLLRSISKRYHII